MLIIPGSTIGIVGGGQLGRMLILECRRMGYKTVVLDPDNLCPAAQVANASYDFSRVSDFIKACDVATYEFEHIDIKALLEIEKDIPLLPCSAVLSIKQTRASEKSYLKEKGFPVPNFRIFNDTAQVPPYIKGKQVVIKKSAGGYDGKGLYTVKSLPDFESIKNELANEELVVEELVPYVKEISVICGRNIKGDITVYPIAENVHKNGILHYTLAPAGVAEKTKNRAYEIAVQLIKTLDIKGLLCVEMFLLQDGEILINEFAPRPHNSGHYTIDACDVSQFELFLRAICGFPMVAVECFCNAAMLNIIGKGIDSLDFEKILSLSGVKIHLYGKKDVRSGRKMGHINIIGKDREDVRKKLEIIKDIVYQP
jgi:5-(carboxyamino)imidazole ribonucleotide synthase